MAYVTTLELLKKADENGYAVGAFNVENMEMAQAVIKAAEDLKAPVILQTTSSTLKYAKPNVYFGIVSELAKNASVPVALHLDHGSSYELSKECINSGYSSVMIDGSHSSFEENIAISKKVADFAKTKNIPVEAELGKVGGKEDELDGGSGNYTDPLEAKEFAEKTGVTSLAVAIGTAHGIYKETPVLDKKRLEEIRKVVSIPLVLHGASGISEEDLKDCIKLGISKINFATELRIAYSDGVKAYMETDQKVFDPKKYGDKGREFVYNLVCEKIKICGCANTY